MKGSGSRVALQLQKCKVLGSIGSSSSSSSSSNGIGRHQGDDGDVVDWIRRLDTRRTTINSANLRLKRTPTAAFITDIACVALSVPSSGRRPPTRTDTHIHVQWDQNSTTGRRMDGFGLSVYTDDCNRRPPMHIVGPRRAQHRPLWTDNNGKNAIKEKLHRQPGLVKSWLKIYGIQLCPSMMCHGAKMVNAAAVYWTKPSTYTCTHTVHAVSTPHERVCRGQTILTHVVRLQMKSVQT